MSNSIVSDPVAKVHTATGKVSLAKASDTTGKVSLVKIARKPAFLFWFEKKADAAEFLEDVDRIPGIIVQHPIEAIVNGKRKSNLKRVVVTGTGSKQYDNDLLNLLNEKAAALDGHYMSGILGYITD